MNTYYTITRAACRNVFLSLLGTLAKPAPGVHILNAHRLLDECESMNRFERILDYLSECSKLVSIDYAIHLIIEHAQPSEPIIAFTFDDGFMECYTHFAPALDKYGIKGLFFINPNYVNGDNGYIEFFNSQAVLTPNKTPMRWSHIKELQHRGHIIGAHTMDHYMINDTNIDTLDYQIGYCRSVIEEKLEQSCDYFAFPYGRLEHANPISIDIACQYYKYIFSQSDYKHYFSYDGRVINRRHFEPFWPISHIKYFLSCKKS